MAQLWRSLSIKCQRPTKEGFIQRRNQGINGDSEGPGESLPKCMLMFSGLMRPTFFGLFFGLELSSQRSDFNLIENLWQYFWLWQNYCPPMFFIQSDSQMCKADRDLFQKTCSCNPSQRWFYLILTKRNYNQCMQPTDICLLSNFLRQFQFVTLQNLEPFKRSNYLL